MPRARDLLARFRPVGTPGAAGPAGVPADRRPELVRELQPVFDDLAEAQQDAARVRAEATAAAARRRSEAAEQARALVAAGHRDADVQRAEAAARVLRDVEQETAATLAAADREAAEIARRAADRYPALAARLADAVRESLAGDAVPGAAR